MWHQTPVVNGNRLVRALKRDGWWIDRRVGDHVQLKHRDHPGTATVKKDSKDVPLGTLTQILKVTGLSPGRLKQLL